MAANTRKQQWLESFLFRDHCSRMDINNGTLPEGQQDRPKTPAMDDLFDAYRTPFASPPKPTPKGLPGSAAGDGEVFAIDAEADRIRLCYDQYSQILKQSILVIHSFQVIITA